MEGVLETLKKDPTSRQGVMMTWDPSSDSLTNGIKRKNVPCNLGIVLNIIDNKLHVHSIWRSVDMILGFPHDLAGNALLSYIWASYLGVEVGSYTHYIVNAHVYDIHFDVANELISRKSEQKKIDLRAGKDWYTKGSKGDEELTNSIIKTLEGQYTPLDAIKGIKIVI